MAVRCAMDGVWCAGANRADTARLAEGEGNQAASLLYFSNTRFAIFSRWCSAEAEEELEMIIFKDPVFLPRS